MSDASQLPDLAQLGLAFARTAAEELASVVGAEVRLKGPTVKVVASTRAIQADGPVVQTRLKAEDEGLCHLVVPRADAATLAGLLMGEGSEAIEALRKGPLELPTLEAFGEVAKLLTASLSRVFQQESGLPALVPEEHAEVEAPDEKALGDTRRCLVARYRLLVPDHEDGGLDLIFPEESARRWFSDELGDEASQAVGGDGEGMRILFIDADEGARNHAEELEDQLGHEVWVLDPSELEAQDAEELAEVGVIVVAWSLGIRPGLSILEWLQLDERMRRIPVLMADARPTEPMVRAALRAGAASFVTTPYDAEELRARLQTISSRPVAS